MKPSNLIGEIAKRLKTVERPLIYSFLIGLAMLVPNIALPALCQQFIDKVLVLQTYDWTFGLIGGIGVLGVVSIIMNFLQRFVMARLSTNLSLRFSSSFLWHILRLPMAFYQQRDPGEISNRMPLNVLVSSALTGNIGISFINAILVAGYAITLYTYDVLLASIAIATTLLNLWFVNAIYRDKLDLFVRVRQESSKARAYAIGALQNIDTIKATATETKFFSRWSGLYTKAFNSFQEANKTNILLGSIPNLFSAFSEILIIGFGAWKIMNGYLTLGMFLAIQMLMRSLTIPLQTLVNLSQNIQLLSVDLARLDDVLLNKLDPLIENDELKTKTNTQQFLEKLAGSVEVSDVTFGYTSNVKPVISEVNFTLNPGKCVALAGISGSGKTTLAKVIGGLAIPWSGQILFDNRSIFDIPRVQFADSLAICEQSVFLFPGNVKDNISLYDPSIIDDYIIAAAKDACIHDVIMKKKGGYEYLVSEQGNNFSGGERQRLEIARCLAKNPTILILDEATSGLDSDIEHEIIRNIRRRGCACLIIAHRLSTIRNCDEIIVMDNGQIVQKGTHEELKNIPGIYQNLIKSELTG